MFYKAFTFVKDYVKRRQQRNDDTLVFKMLNDPAAGYPLRTPSEIAEKTGLSRHRVDQSLKRLEIDGRVKDYGGSLDRIEHDWGIKH